MPTDSSKKLPTEGGRGQKSSKIADVLNGWSHNFDDLFGIFNIEAYLGSKFFFRQITVMFSDWALANLSMIHDELFFHEKLKNIGLFFSTYHVEVTRY